MLNRHIDIVLWIIACLLLLTGCGGSEDDNILGAPAVRVQLGYIFGSASSASQTRQTADVVQSDNTRRAVEILSLVPMTGNSVALSEIVPSGDAPVDKPDNTASPTGRFYHYNVLSMTPGADRCLVYARAADVVGKNKAYNGSLAATIPAGVLSADMITFAPKAIYEGTTATDAAKDLGLSLTRIANVGGWKDATDPYLRQLYDNFLNHGNDLPGSAVSVRAWMRALQTSLTALTYDEGTGDDNLRDAIVHQIDQELSSISSITYPRDNDLPDGAAVLRWSEWTEYGIQYARFVPQLQTTTINNINTVSRFAYPAALYFFGDSHLKTTPEEVNFNTLYSTATTWNDVLAHFPNRSVTGTTKAAVLEKPVQYAVAQLKLTVRADGILKDAEETVVSLKDGDVDLFPLTGIIVCGQRPVGYDFAPKDNSDADVKFMYDSQVASGSYLSATATPQTTMLVLQSYDGEDVIIILEFENQSGQTFTCLDGKVYPGTRFYLVGQVKATAGTGGDATSTGRVFTKDYTTEVNMNVVSLAKAYNALPNILSSNLEIGIETTPKWIAAEPANLKLY